MELMSKFFRNLEKNKIDEDKLEVDLQTLRKLQYLKAFKKNLNTEKIELEYGISYIKNGIFYVKRKESINMNYISLKTSRIFNHISRVQEDGIIYQESLITLKDYSKICDNNALLEIFYKIIEKTAELNELGFIHRNLNENNITITKKLEIRFSGLNKLYFLGMNDPLKLENKNYQNIFIRTEAYEDYSYDMYIIAKMFYRIVSKRNKTILFTGYNVYSYQEIDKIDKISKEELIEINNFSVYFLDFLSKTTCKNSINRLTCKEALNHDIFNYEKIEIKKYYNSLIEFKFPCILEDFYKNYWNQTFKNKEKYITYNDFKKLFLYKKCIEGKESIQTLKIFFRNVDLLIYIFEEEEEIIIEVFEDLIKYIEKQESKFQKYFSQFI